MQDERTQADRRQYLLDLFAEAVELPVEERPAWVARQECDEWTRKELESLLGHREAAKVYFREVAQQVGMLVGAAPHLPEGSCVGNRFRIGRMLGRRRSRETYQAVDESNSRSVVLRLMTTAGEPGSPGAAEFQNDARAAQRIRSTHVCRVQSWGWHSSESTGDMPFYTTDFLSGETLAKLMHREGALPLETAKDIVRQLTDAFHGIEASGLPVPNLDGGSVMLCPDGRRTRAVIFDLPIGMEDDDGAAPVHSLGLLLFEMVTGRNPSQEGARGLPSPRIWNPRIPLEWDRAIVRCVNPDPAKRFRDVREATAALGYRSGIRSLVSRRSVAAGGVLLSMAAAGVWLLRPSIPTGRTATLAILPFHSSAVEIQYLANGTADRIGESLMTVPDLWVIGRPATRRLPSGTTLAELARRFHANYVLSGALTQRERDFQIDLDVSDELGTRVWSATYTVPPTQLAGIPEQFVQSAVRALNRRPPRSRIDSFAGVSGRQADAYRLYLLGRHHMDRRDTLGLREGVDCLERASRLLPQSAEIHATLTSALYHVANREGMATADLIARARQQAELALKVDSESAEAWFVLGAIAFRPELRWHEAETSLRKAIELWPSYWQAHSALASLLSVRGRFSEALDEVSLALALDPFNPTVLTIQGSVLSDAGRHRDAIGVFERVTGTNPAFVNGYLEATRALSALGQWEEARVSAQKAVSLSVRSSAALSLLGYVEARMGQTEPALDLLAELASRHREKLATAAQIAAIHSGLGQPDAALEWLDRACREPDPAMVRLKVDPVFQSLRGDPRFRAVLKRMNL